MTCRIGVIGFGEVGQTLARDLTARGATVTVYDLRFDDPQDDLRERAGGAAVAAAENLQAAAQGRDLVISAVTAGAAEEVAGEAAARIGSALFLDLNSISPAARGRAAAALAACNARYVEAAVMAPIAPKRLATPILLGGPHAAAAEPMLADLGFDARVFSETVGRASAVKMCRSVFVKGLESIVSESLLAARRYGVEAEVLGSYGNILPADDWPAIARYLITRTLVHGRRRSEEMAEAARTVADAGLPAWMSEGAARRQAWAADLALDVTGDADLDALLDVMLARAPETTA